MKLIFKYLKPYTIIIAVCIILLFGQSFSDLYLPNLMSDIVDTGIMSGGIEKGAPDVISAQGIDILRIFMSDEQKQAADNSFELIKAGSAGSENYTKKFSGVSNKDFYVLKDGLSEQQKKDADTAYSNATYSMMLFLKDVSGSSSQSISDYGNSESGFSDFDITKLYVMTDSLKMMPTQSFEKYISSAEENPYLAEQVSAKFTTLFYKELGANTSSLQKSYIIKVGAEMLGITLLGVLASVLVGYLSSLLSAKVAKKLRRDMFEKVNSFTNAEIDRFSTASLITRTTNDIQQISMFIVMGLRMMCSAPIMGIGGIFLAIDKSVSMSWIIAVAVIFVLGFLLVILSIAMPKFKSLQKLIDRLNLVSRENLSGLLVIRAFGNEEHEEKRFEGANRNLRDTTQFVNRTISSIFPFMMFVMNVFAIAVTWIGSHEIANATLQVGDMMAFIQYAMQIIMSFIFVAMMFIFIPRAIVSAERIREVLDCELSVIDPKEAKVLGKASGKVEFRDVCFRYSKAESDVLENISFTANPGETTAIIGATGSGKSTLISLIPRFYDVTGGSVLIDGIDIRELNQHELRESIGFVPQKGVLFSGTIDSNVKYGMENASVDEVMKALEVAQASAFVDEKEDGIMSPIAQDATNVSGGQKQRLSIARALIKKPPIYIFDDSFSALDFKTDASLRKALKNFTGESTVIIVAQRVSTIMQAEQIIVLDEGRIVGKGTHSELVETCPEYREIAESQLSKEEV